MKLLIVGLGSMGKRRARLSKGIDAALHIVGVDTAEARRAEACTLGLADAAYPTIAEAVAALVLVTAIGKVLIHVVARMPMGRGAAET